MSNEHVESLERSWADETLKNYTRDALVEFLAGNPSPAWDLAVFCSDEQLPKLVDAVIAGACSEAEDFAEELVMAVLRGLLYRYRSGDLPDMLGSALIRSIRQNAGGKSQ